jgi:hypothetical protein
MGRVAQMPKGDWIEVASGVVTGDVTDDSTEEVALEIDPGPTVARRTLDTAATAVKAYTRREVLRIMIRWRS